MTDGSVMHATMREPPNATVKRRRRGGCLSEVTTSIVDFRAAARHG